MKKYFVGIFALLLLTGAGCAAVQDREEVTHTGMEDDNTVTTVVEEMETEDQADTTEISDASETAEPVPEQAAVNEVVFNLTGVNFTFSETSLTVNKGNKVTINFTSNAGFHDWVIDEFGASTDKVNAGQSTSVTFVAGEAGEYEYYCSVGNHRAQGMVGKLIVR